MFISEYFNVEVSEYGVFDALLTVQIRYGTVYSDQIRNSMNR